VGPAANRKMTSFPAHKGCDAIVDQALALQNADDPQLMLSVFDGGERLHPTDGGYQLIANAVNLSVSGRAHHVIGAGWHLLPPDSQ
jgi:lysophospholipase L1-like esterase